MGPNAKAAIGLREFESNTSIESMPVGVAQLITSVSEAHFAREAY